MNMFNFVFDIGNYEDRKVARDDYSWGFISTASVFDGAHPYETAVEHKDYNKGKMVIVEAYDTKKKAVTGHVRWKQIMTSKELPEKLVDCSNAVISQLCETFGVKTEYERKKSS